MPNAEKIDWKSLEFTCNQEKNPPLDPEADAWYRHARDLQKRDQDKYIHTIVELFQKAIVRNHYNAMHRLALLYIDGYEGSKPDEHKAVELIERVIKLNVASGYYQMGVFLEQGIGVKQDRAASLTYMRKAADMGNPQGQLAAGKKMIEDFLQTPERERVVPIGKAMLECALKQDLAKAGYELGVHYAMVEENSELALKSLQAAAALGDGDSLFRLHSTFADGKYGAKTDPQRAACYERLWRESEADKTKRFPNLNIICPLPPMPMPSVR